MRTVVAIFLGAVIGEAAEPAPTGPIIELPPMIVAEASGVPWLYAQVGQTEYLSRCSMSVTREFIAAETEAHLRLRLLIPESLLVMLDLPKVSLLAPLEAKRATDDAVLREMLRVEEELSRRDSRPAAAGGLRLPALNQYRFMPNLRLDDRDMSTVFTYVDERTFQGEHLIAADDLVHYVLSRRAPMLPPWLTEGLVSLYRLAHLRRDQVTLRPLVWCTEEAQRTLVRDPQAPRTLLPPGELFSETVFRGEANQRELRVATWRAQTALFVRWALDPQNVPADTALWKFVEGVSTRAVTEPWFVECFGFGFSDLRDRLSDYLPVAVKEPLTLRATKLPAAARFEIKVATAQQVSRLRGECERLEIPYVRRRSPQFLDRYVEQARRTLRRAYERGDRDPRLVAALGLCEVDTGDATAARPLLEFAAAAGVNRPRALFECARLRWEAMTREVPANQMLPLTESSMPMAALRPALVGSPPLPEVYLLFAEIWLRTDAVPPAADLALLADGTRLFVRNAAIAIRVALLHIRAGRRTEADSILATGLPFLGDESMRTRFEQLRQALQNR